MSTKVTLRKSKISDGRHSYYLDFYPAILLPDRKQPTRRQFLGLYLRDDPKTSIDKNYNKEITAIAEQCRDKMIFELNKQEIYPKKEIEVLLQNKKNYENNSKNMHPIIQRAIAQNEPPERTFAKLMDAVKYIESTAPEILTAEDYNAVLNYLPTPSNPYYVAYIEEIQKNILNKIKLNS